MAKKKEAPKVSVPEWILTYGDLMSLLLCFFILLAAFSELKRPEEYRKVLESIQQALGVDGGMGVADINEKTANTMISNLQELARLSDDQLSRNDQNVRTTSGRQPQVQVIHEGGRHAIGGPMPFDPGEFELSPRVRSTLLTEVAPLLRDRRNVVLVVGHAWGEVDKAKSGFDLRDLSYFRAKSVVEFLVREGGVDEKILIPEVAGQSQPISTDIGSVQAVSNNRRVEVYMTDRTIDELHPDPDFTGRKP